MTQIRRVSDRIEVIVEPGDPVGQQAYRGTPLTLARRLTAEELAVFDGVATPRPAAPSKPVTTAFTALGLVMALAAAMVFTLNARDTYFQASRNEPYMVEWRSSQRAMAAALAQFPDGIVWQSYTWPDWAIPVSLLGFWEHGRIQRGGTLFVNRREYWETQYPGQTPAEIEAELFRRTNETVDVALVLSDPGDMPMGMEPYSRALAAGIAVRVSADPKWRRVGEVAAAPFSKPLVIFVRQGGRARPGAGP